MYLISKQLYLEKTCDTLLARALRSLLKIADGINHVVRRYSRDAPRRSTPRSFCIPVAVISGRFYYTGRVVDAAGASRRNVSITSDNYGPRSRLFAKRHNASTIAGTLLYFLSLFPLSFLPPSRLLSSSPRRAPFYLLPVEIFPLGYHPASFSPAFSKSAALRAARETCDRQTQMAAGCTVAQAGPDDGSMDLQSLSSSSHKATARSPPPRLKMAAEPTGDINHTPYYRATRSRRADSRPPLLPLRALRNERGSHRPGRQTRHLCCLSFFFPVTRYRFCARVPARSAVFYLFPLVSSASSTSCVRKRDPPRERPSRALFLHRRERSRSRTGDPSDPNARKLGIVQALVSDAVDAEIIYDV